MNYLKINIYILLFFNLFCIKILIGNELDVPIIAKWYNGYAAAVGLRFDDGLESHVKFVIPKLNEFDIKATFMVNPGRNSFQSSYKKYKDFWEKKVPAMGHRLGNHTMHHRGAGTIEEADYEIGQVSRIIWKLYPDKSKLTVFASGGGEKWGGKRWSNADPGYRALTKKYNLIDLYDGNHPAIQIDSDTNISKLQTNIDDAISKKESVVFCFHQVGSPRIIDYLQRFLKNIDLTISEKDFTMFIEYLNSKREKIWIVPLIQIYKYAEEYKQSELELEQKLGNKIIYKLNVQTDPELYDQKLSIKFPNSMINSKTRIKQDGTEINIHKTIDSFSIVNVMPKNSILEILN